jgi:hypothetical protein
MTSNCNKFLIAVLSKKSFNRTRGFLLGEIMTPWEIKGREFNNCNCAYGCPCQFLAPPTFGTCEATMTVIIDEGYYGDIKLDGLKLGGMYKWPGAVHEGNGEYQLFIDETASDAQRAAIEKIATGQDTEDMATMWWIFNAMCPTQHNTEYKHIDAEINVDGRTGSSNVEGIFEVKGQPIKNPITGADHRAQISLPQGFEYNTAEVGSATTTTTGGAIDLPNNKDTYAQFAHLHLTNSGVVR